VALVHLISDICKSFAAAVVSQMSVKELRMSAIVD